jgi:hypothetical protein
MDQRIPVQCGLELMGIQAGQRLHPGGDFAMFETQQDAADVNEEIACARLAHGLFPIAQSTAA